MNQKLYERRIECLNYYSKGVKPSVFTEDLSKKYDVLAKTIWHDWNMREQWLNVVANMEKPEVVLAECKVVLDKIIEASWRIYYEDSNGFVRVAALKAALEANTRRQELVSPKGEVGTPTRPFIIKKWCREDAETTDAE